MSNKEHPYIRRLHEQFADKRCSRREFLRTATLLGMSAGTAYAFANKFTGAELVSPARAAMPQGGTLRISMVVQELSNPHTYEWSQYNITQQVCPFLTRTGHDNVTRPHLVRDWEVNEELTSWTFHLRPDVKWHNGRSFTAEDVAWNINRILDPKTGSSGLGLMKSYLLNVVENGDEKTTEIWDANAIEVVDDKTFRLNLKQPQLAVPEHLFHYTMHMIDPEEDGVFGVGSNGTGPFQLVDLKLGEYAVLKAYPDYWGEGPYLDELRFIDLGDD
ncbi:MAG: ABC transporter substrate-binding protein, partial [Rhodovibrionaceae bacterium]